MIQRTRALAAGALLAAVAVPAYAGGFAPAVTEVPVAAPTPVVVATPPAPSGDWTGFYLGGQVSYGQLDYNLDDDARLDDSEFDGAIGGVHGGYLRDFGRVVAGAELAYDWANLDANDDNGAASFAPGADLDSVFRAGVRVGYDAGRVLPYATAGYAKANFSDTVAGTDSDSADGTYYGAGVEYALTDRFSLGGEVLRHNFDLDLDDVDSNLTTVGVRASFRF